MSENGWQISNAGLAGLEQKYQCLVGLRAKRDKEGPVDKNAIAALSRSHPGCLRELDRLPLSALQARLHGVQAAISARQQQPPPGFMPQWLRWMDAYHHWLGVALAAKTPENQGLPLEKSAAALSK